MALVQSAHMDELVRDFEGVIAQNNCRREQLNNMIQLDKEELLRAMKNQTAQHELTISELQSEVTRLVKDNEDLRSTVEKLQLSYHSALNVASIASTKATKAETDVNKTQQEVVSLRFIVDNMTESMESLLLGQLGYTFVREAAAHFTDPTLLIHDEPIEDWKTLEESLHEGRTIQTFETFCQTKIQASLSDVHRIILTMTGGRVSAAHPVRDFRSGQPITSERLVKLIEFFFRYDGPKKRALRVLDAVVDWRKNESFVLAGP